ncbi:MAG: signal peptidase II [Dehalococcoidales bacterium]|nr:signal peptidase II [Dehalococcoidales bacterium]MDZ4230360.1 signal peptidase II [Dehalococcoidales bacterium]
MKRADSLRAGLWNALFFLTALLVSALDQLTKLWIRANLDLGESLPLTGWLRLTHIRNPGAAFGLFQGFSFTLTVLAIAGIIALLVFFIFFYHRFPFLNDSLSKPALGLILGGTVGNLIDRLRLGSVTDFVDFGFWPAFNVADASIVIGALIFAYSLLFPARAKQS